MPGLGVTYVRALPGSSQFRSVLVLVGSAEQTYSEIQINSFAQLTVAEGIVEGPAQV